MAENTAKLHFDSDDAALADNPRYRAWRERHLRECDAHYVEFCKEHPEVGNSDQDVFDREFSEWRARRAGRNAGSARVSASNPTTTTLGGA